MSERPITSLEEFVEEFVGPVPSKSADAIKEVVNAIQGGPLERRRDAVVGVVQESGAVPIVAAGVVSASPFINPIMAAAHNLSHSFGPRVTRQAKHNSDTHGRQPEEVSFVLQPGGSIYPIAVEEAPIMGVGITDAEAQIEVASDISPSQVTDLAIGTEIEVPLHYKFAAVPQGRDLDWMDAQYDMTLAEDLEVNPTYRANPDDVQAHAEILVDTSTRTTATPISAQHPRHHEHHHVSTTLVTGGAEAPAPAQEKPASTASQHKTTEHSKVPAPIQPHHVRTVTPEEQPQPKPTHSAQPKVHSTIEPSFGTGLQFDFGQAFSTAGTSSAEQTHRLVQSTIGHIASMMQEVVKGITPSKTEHSSHTEPMQAKTPPPASSEKSLPNAGQKYDIYSNVLDKSGFSTVALQYALSQMEGGSMADLAGPIHYVEQKYGINSLYVAAAGCIESACGTSNFARERNNDFGIEAYTNNPDDASRFPSQSANVVAFAQLLHDNYLHPGAQYWGGSASLHSIYKNYSTSHDSEALSISEVMNTLAAHASYYDEMHGLTSDATNPSAHPQLRNSAAHRSPTQKHAKKHHSGSSTITSIYKALAHAWDNPLG